MKVNHDAKCAEMRERWRRHKIIRDAPERDKPVKKRAARSKRIPRAARPLPTGGDFEIMRLKQARDVVEAFCRKNCVPNTVGHHHLCATWMWDGSGRRHLRDDK